MTAPQPSRAHLAVVEVSFHVTWTSEPTDCSASESGAEGGAEAVEWNVTPIAQSLAPAGFHARTR